ncbi:hypothetical protein MYX75_00155 [Acidobacteria bacterium AH-259-A15]|nr:hypothetical protein [Acidobacteria bacterium AH-259-A15]
MTNNDTIRQKIDCFIAITPDAAWELQERKISFQKCEDFYDESDLTGHSERILNLEEKWTRWVDGYLQRLVPEFQELDFRPAHSYFYFLKILIDELFMVSFIIEHILSSRTSDLIFFKTSRNSDINSDLIFRESLYSQILPLFATKYKVETMGLDYPFDKRDPVCLDRRQEPQLLERLREVGRSLAPRSLLEQRRLIKRHGWKEFLGLITGPSCDRTVLVVHDAYDISPLDLEARRRGLCFEVWSEVVRRSNVRLEGTADFASQLSSIWDSLVEETFFWTPFKYSDVDLRPVAEPRLSFWWRNVIPKMWMVFIHARQVLKDSRPSVVLAPWANRWREATVLQAARSLRIPTVVYQHGGFGGNCEYPLWEFTDLAQADYMFFYGSGTADYYRERIGRFKERRAEPVVVGSSRLDALRNSRRNLLGGRLMDLFDGPRRPIVLYVPDMLKGYRRCLSYGEYPDVSYFELQLDMIELFREYPNIYFVYKVFPGEKNPISTAKVKVSSNCRVTYDILLPQLIWVADLVIFDIPSTGLLEGLLTRNKIIVYADKRSIRMTSQAKKLLRRRAILAESPADYLNKVRQVLTSGDFSKEPLSNNDFLKAYGTHLNDGRSIERAVEALYKISQRISNP